MADPTAAPPGAGSDAAMRLSSLCGRPVTDASGQRRGSVHDIRVVRDGPTNVSGDAAFRIDGLVVGDDGWVQHIGLFRHAVHGPWLLKAIAARLGPRRTYLPWPQLSDPHELASGGPVRFEGELQPIPGRNRLG